MLYTVVHFSKTLFVTTVVKPITFKADRCLAKRSEKMRIRCLVMFIF